MSSFFGKLKSNTDSKSPNATSAAKQKADPNAIQPTPLERMLQNAGPIRNDGSDKFWGMENFGNTCYCNSILQSLYYTVPFRENMLSYPQKSTTESINTAAATATPRPKFPASNPINRPGAPPANRNGTGIPAQQKPEDKDSPEYKKKQALLAGPVLNMSYQNAASYSMPESLYSAVKDIFEAVINSQSRYGVISPSKVVEVLRRENEMFRGQLHQDAHEFLNILLNNISDSIEAHEKKIADKPIESNQQDSQANSSGPTETSAVSFPSFLPMAPPAPMKWLRDMFEGAVTAETRCLTCENVSQRDEPFLDLSVDLEQHTSVTSCLRRYSEEEMLCERNKFHCDNCGGLQEAERRVKISKLPRVLALHLKRFKVTDDYGRTQKLFHKVVYPYHLRLFNTTDDASDPDRLYELYAVVVHIGSGMFHGHYVAVIKTQDRGWLLFDDEMVEPVDRSYVKNFFGDKQGQATAYVLFYQETTIEAVRAEQRRERKRRASLDLVDEAAMKAKESAEMHRVQSVSPTRVPEIGDFSRLDHAATAPPLQPNGHIDVPRSPVMAPVTTGPQSKKEKAKEEKERKAAEKAAEKNAKKEKEKEEREKRAQLHERLAEAARQNAEQMKWAMDESKKTAKEEGESRKAEAKVLGNSEDSQSNGVSLGLDRFKRSKSLRFGSMGKKDKKPSGSEDSTTGLSAIDDTTPHDSPKEKDKKRFSIRKKSFGVLGNS